jgi:hypothetical protein
MSSEVMKDMERYITNRLGDDGQPIFFECFIRAQKEVYDKLVKRFHKSFLESKDYELYLQDRMNSIRETIKSADAKVLESSEAQSKGQEFISLTKIGDSNLTVGFIDELGFFSTGNNDDSELGKR